MGELGRRSSRNYNYGLLLKKDLNSNHNALNRLVLLLANTLTFLGTLYVNYIYASGSGPGQSVGEVSDQYSTMITPAGYAFSIWGLIYLLLLGFVVNQWLEYFKGWKDESLSKSGIWFTLANVFNGLWIIVWTSEQLGFSVLVIFLLLFCLIQLALRLGLEMWEAPKRVIILVWWPICLYLGWIVLASVVNSAVVIKDAGILEGLFNETAWTIIVIIVAVLIYFWLTFARNMREAALVGTWGIAAIAYRHWDSEATISIAALIAAILLFIASSFHAYNNRKSMPFKP